MPEKSRLNELAEHRKLLLLEADLHRNLIALEVEKLRDAVTDLDSHRQQITSSPWLLAGSTITGLFALRHWRQVARWAPAAITVFQWVKSVIKK